MRSTLFWLIHIFTDGRTISHLFCDSTDIIFPRLSHFLFVVDDPVDGRTPVSPIRQFQDWPWRTVASAHHWRKSALIYLSSIRRHWKCKDAVDGSPQFIDLLFAIVFHPANKCYELKLFSPTGKYLFSKRGSNKYRNPVTRTIVLPCIRRTIE